MCSSIDVRSPAAAGTPAQPGGPERARFTTGGGCTRVVSGGGGAWTTGAADDEVPTDPGSTAPLVAAMWLAAVRSLIVGRRPDLSEGADPEQAAITAAALADRMLAGLEQGVELVRGRARTTAIRTDVGWPHDAVRRAG